MPAATPRPETSLVDSARCPCLSGQPYDECCGPLHAGDPAPTAERLMRSRYSAFVLRRASYLLSTWHASTRPATLELDDDVRWFRLDIVRTERGGPFDRDGVVEFAAHYRSGGEAGVQHEVSRFVRVDGRWQYVAAIG
ncbi:YchJ family protein [Frigoribacterium sp. 2-23]|uniref:YchJ family protein n=1 Tax=Frigoribacterium sp. 2-23 TaxID=3415006 RepID=UPI003C6EB990